MKQVHQTRVSKKRREVSTIIIARGDRIRYFTVRPWLTVITGGIVIALVAGYIAATAYLVLRDNLMNAAFVQQTQLQQAYEGRIAALRAELDRITSQQILEQHLMQQRIDELMERQELLTRRHSRLSPVLERAGRLSRSVETIPIPSPRPDTHAHLGKEEPDRSIITGTAFWASSPQLQVPWPFRPTHGSSDPDQLFQSLNRSLHNLEADQLHRIDTVAEEAFQTAEAIAEALSAAGIPVADDYGEGDVGGPLFFAGENLPFEDRVRELDDVLSRLEELKQKARRIPIANPIPGAAVTSGFGVRRDPLIGRPAHHSGIDFRARMGAPVRSAAAGRIIKAGWTGGYGRMVEIDHGDGISTRYAHLKKVLVKEGDEVGTGEIVGHVGSSGRSTGPHLHYEVRRNGRAVNPLQFIAAGRRIIQYL
ncbi:M23 family metallopeptidase [Chelativorans sp. Marseille-P2723]|uniref:M23 family metallopeptidase n=1 Tax=Chelativorans sp. Marseille-P2723 TaxID=2709133 RepID=UPI00156E6FB7|nr:M23 family metallopeptidase [Chelativorans sp. Marseille-P2723]